MSKKMTATEKRQRKQQRRMMKRLATRLAKVKLKQKKQSFRNLVTAYANDMISGGETHNGYKKLVMDCIPLLRNSPSEKYRKGYLKYIASVRHHLERISMQKATCS